MLEHMRGRPVDAIRHLRQADAVGPSTAIRSATMRMCWRGWATVRARRRAWRRRCGATE